MKHKKFKHLEFKPHPGDRENGLMAKLPLKTLKGKDVIISVVTNIKEAGRTFYGIQEENTYEVAVFYKENFIKLGEWDDVLGWQSPEDIDKLMKKIQRRELFTWANTKEPKEVELARFERQLQNANSKPIAD